jgi:hypothetical protein
MATGVLLHAPDDPRLAQIVGRHFHPHAVAYRQADPTLAHLATDRGEDEMLVVEFYPEHGAGQNGFDTPFHFKVLFFTVWPINHGNKNKKGGVRFTPPRLKSPMD